MSASGGEAEVTRADGDFRNDPTRTSAVSTRTSRRLFNVFHDALVTFRLVKMTKISMRESTIEQTSVASLRKTFVKRCDCGSSSRRT